MTSQAVRGFLDFAAARADGQLEEESSSPDHFRKPIEDAVVSIGESAWDGFASGSCKNVALILESLGWMVSQWVQADVSRLCTCLECSYATYKSTLSSVRDLFTRVYQNQVRNKSENRVRKVILPEA